ncbi:hypothetical protein ACJD0Z_14480 [Flavobacteriaceae bacterium M23B6Z8]
MNLTTALQFFIRSDEKGLQLDFFRDDGQVLLQIYKGNEVATWNKVYVIDENELLLLLRFHKSKTDNESNFNRFMSLNTFTQFRKIKDQNQIFYYQPVSATTKIPMLQRKILDIIFDVYDLRSNQFSFTLNAY